MKSAEWNAELTTLLGEAVTRFVYAIGIVIGAAFLLAAALVAYWAASPEEREKAP